MKTSTTRKASHAACAALLLGVAGLVTGCSGINATKSVSPLDFLLPGLMQNDKPVAPAAEKAEVALTSRDSSEPEKATPSAGVPENANLLP